MWLWVIATIVGVGIGLAAGVVVVEQGGRFITGQAMNVVRLTPLMCAFSLFVVGSVAGTVLGVAQWLVLRRETVRIRNWVSATAAGLASGFCISSLVVDVLIGGIASPLGVLSFVLVAGVVFGLLTGRPLRHAV